MDTTPQSTQNRVDLNITLEHATVDYLDGQLIILDSASGVSVTLGADLVDTIWQLLPTGGMRERLARIADRNDAEFNRFVAGVDRARKASA